MATAYKDYYATLGVSRGASSKDVRSAYRKLAAKHHPDRNPGDAAAEEKFKEIGEAYAVLGDEEKRRRRGVRRHGLGERRQEQACEEQRADDERGEAGAAALLHAGCALDIGGGGRGAKC